MTKDLFLKILKEPLFQFLVVGLVLFMVLDSRNQSGEGQTPRSIAVSREDLIRYLEFRAKIIQPDTFAAELESLSVDELQSLIDNYVREEVLFREAKNLGLDKDDYGARRRLIQQLEFINQGVVSSSIQLTEVELKSYLMENQDRYREPATISFTHVFLNAKLHGADGANKRAQALLSELNSKPSIPFQDAGRFGDRFLFHLNYVGKDSAEINSHFGAEMGKSLFALKPSEDRWQGPLQSEYGSHLILLIEKTEPGLPTFADLRSRLKEDAFQARLRDRLFQLEKSVVDQYAITIHPDLQKRLSEGGDL